MGHMEGVAEWREGLNKVAFIYSDALFEYFLC